MSIRTSEWMNAMRWDRECPGHYEVWYLTMLHRQSGHGFWIRYTLHAPKQGDPRASLWFARFSPDSPDETLAHKVTFPADALTAERVPFRLEMPQAGLTNEATWGNMDCEAGLIRWDLTFPDQGPSLKHMPDLLYDLSSVKTKVMSPHLDIPMTGMIEVCGRTYLFKEEPGEQSHVWGKKHGHAWCWCHCNAFDEPGVIFEGITARLSLARIRTPWLSLFYLKTPDAEHVFNDLRGLWHRRSCVTPPSWRFSARAQGALLEGCVSAREERIVEGLYEDPDGERLSCFNSIIGDLTLRWTPPGQETQHFASASGAAVEFGLRTAGWLHGSVPHM